MSNDFDEVSSSALTWIVEFNKLKKSANDYKEKTGKRIAALDISFIFEDGTRVYQLKFTLDKSTQEAFMNNVSPLVDEQKEVKYPPEFYVLRDIFLERIIKNET